VIDWKET